MYSKLRQLHKKIIYNPDPKIKTFNKFRYSLINFLKTEYTALRYFKTNLSTNQTVKIPFTIGNYISLTPKQPSTYSLDFGFQNLCTIFTCATHGTSLTSFRKFNSVGLKSSSHSSNSICLNTLPLKF